MPVIMPADTASKPVKTAPARHQFHGLRATGVPKVCTMLIEHIDYPRKVCQSA
ncbi:MAG: hypothetical protein KBD39_00330 [Sterolibacterium sp.]|nr:hypothetical protein [Sterolibacterium sp.]MBP9798558.1 hypothetical protein [Sterolibacterium sp.]